MSFEYTMCAAATAEDLNKQVNKLLAEGWVLYGNPFSTSPENGSKGMLCQALTKMPKKVAGVR